MTLSVSVITVAYNAARTIEATLDSVASQTATAVQHIVIDGASSDATARVVRSFANKVDVFISEPDGGIYDAMNKGIEAADGDVIGFLNADDVFAHRHALQRIEAAFDPEIDAVYADLLYVDGAEPGRVVRYWRSGAYRPGLCLQGWMPAHPTFYVRRELFSRFGGFNLDYPRQADIDLCTRLFEIQRIRSRYLPEVLVWMRTGGISNRSWSGIVKGSLENYRSLKAMGFGVSPYYFVRKFAWRLPQYYRRPPAAVVSNNPFLASPTE